MNNPNIVVIGGGTGLSTLLKGVKKITKNVTAIVSVSDDGGSSGRLREDLGMLPPGDIRNCLLSLAKTEPIMKQLLNYRFNEGDLKGHSFGNLFIAAMDGISENFHQAIVHTSDVLAITGKVLPVTLEDVHLCAELENGEIIKGESKVGVASVNSRIKNVFLEPGNIKAGPDVLDAIKKADIVVMGPGSLYTSVIPNLLVPEVKNALKKTKAKKIYICNIVTQPGETDDHTALCHINAIEDHAESDITDHCILYGGEIPNDLMIAYKNNKAEKVHINEDEILEKGIDISYVNNANIKTDAIWHDPEELAEEILRIYNK